MIYAQKGNQVCRVEEHQIATLIEQGFNIIDDKGTVLQEAVPTDPVLLKKAYVEHRKQIEELKKEIDTLKKANSQKKTTADEKVADVTEEKVEKVEEKADEDVVAKPKKARARKAE